MEEENPPEVTTFPPLESEFISHHEEMKSPIVHLFVGSVIISKCKLQRNLFLLTTKIIAFPVHFVTFGFIFVHFLAVTFASLCLLLKTLIL